MYFTDVSDCELLVMKCLWDASQPISVRAIISELDSKFGKSYKETTIYTFLSNLKKKGFVESYKKGASYFYPIVKEEGFVRDYGQKMRSFWGDDVFALFLESAIYGAECSEADAETVKKLLQSSK